MKGLEPTKRLIKSETLYNLCCAVLETGYCGSTMDYFREIDGRDLNLITEQEAEELILKLKPGSLFPSLIIKENAGQFEFEYLSEKT